MSKSLQQLSDYIGTEPEIRSLINETVKFLKDQWPTNGATVQTVYSLKTVLTDAQIKALPTTLVELVPAQGVGKIVSFLQAVFSSNSIIPYTNLDADFAGIISWEGSAEAATYVDQGFFGNESRVAVINPQGNITGSFIYGASGNLFLFENMALTLGIYNNTLGNLTGGDSANTISVTILYTIVDL
jgi:hypothetical protein